MAENKASKHATKKAAKPTKKADGEAAVRAAIAALPEPDRSIMATHRPVAASRPAADDRIPARDRSRRQHLTGSGARSYASEG
jgi:hypothetical protein